MLSLLNYARHYASTIEKSLSKILRFASYFQLSSRCQARSLVKKYNTNSGDKHCIPTNFDTQLDVSYASVQVL